MMNSLKQAKLRKNKLNKRNKIQVIKQFESNNQNDHTSLISISPQNNRTVYKFFKQNKQQFSYQTYNLCYFNDSFQKAVTKIQPNQKRCISKSQIKNRIFTRLLSEQPKQKSKIRQMRTLLKLKNIKQIKVQQIISRRKQIKKQQTISQPQIQFKGDQNYTSNKYNFFKSPKCLQLDTNPQNMRLRTGSLQLQIKQKQYNRRIGCETSKKIKRWKTQLTVSETQISLMNTQSNMIDGWQIKQNQYDLFL